jgi:3',5'-cyclic AMP phosphodiesterase CpdA
MMSPFTIAQLSDTHIRKPGIPLFNGVDSNTQLQKAIDWLLSDQLSINAVVISGDLTQDGLVEEYQHLRQLLTPLAKQMPIYLALGNHDHFENFMQVFSDYPGIAQTRVQDALQYRVKIGNYQILILDSLEAGNDQGHLNPQRLDWLNQQLQSTTDKTVIVIHHPMIDVGNPLMDDMHVFESEAFGQIVEKHQHIELILCGHIHRTIFGKFKQVPVIIGPSTAHHYPINVTHASAKILSKEAPGFLIHTCVDGKSILSHQIPISPFEKD